MAKTKAAVKHHSGTHGGKGILSRIMPNTQDLTVGGITGVAYTLVKGGTYKVNSMLGGLLPATTPDWVFSLIAGLLGHVVGTFVVPPAIMQKVTIGLAANVGADLSWKFGLPTMLGLGDYMDYMDYMDRASKKVVPATNGVQFNLPGGQKHIVAIQDMSSRHHHKRRAYAMHTA